MKQMILTTIVAACFGTALAAQTPSATQVPASPAASADKPATVLTGCVYREKDVPGRAPNPAERAGAMEDYILADVKPVPATSAGSSTATPGATGTSGTLPAKAGTMYKLEQIADEKLSAAVGKRVEVSGRIDVEASDSTAPSPSASTTKTDEVVGHDRINLPEFEVTSMREVPGSCPATPAGK